MRSSTFERERFVGRPGLPAKLMGSTTSMFMRFLYQASRGHSTTASSRRDSSAVHRRSLPGSWTAAMVTKRIEVAPLEADSWRERHDVMEASAQLPPAALGFIVHQGMACACRAVGFAIGILRIATANATAGLWLSSNGPDRSFLALLPGKRGTDSRRSGGQRPSGLLGAESTGACCPARGARIEEGTSVA